MWEVSLVRIMIRSTAILLLASATFWGPISGSVAGADASDPGGSFTDDDGNVHEGGIEAIAALAITSGCNPPVPYHYCPSSPVTRGEMAAFLARALGLPESKSDHFTDDVSSVFEEAINRMADAGIIQGCNPPTNTRSCPTRTVTRGEMAVFISRAFDLPASTTDHFVDDNGHLYEGAINRLADRGITLGCDPPTNERFCPEDRVLRDQMATFLTRALQLQPLKPRPPVRVRVLSIVGVDLLEVRINGVKELVHLIGVEFFGPGHTCYDEAHSALSDLVVGRVVRLDRDMSDRGPAGLLLRYVFLTDGKFVNADLVERGWAFAFDVPPNSRFNLVFADLQAGAQTANRGQWGSTC